MLAIGTRIGGLCGDGIHYSGIAVVRKQAMLLFLFISIPVSDRSSLLRVRPGSVMAGFILPLQRIMSLYKRPPPL
ncbi:hypothetical protein ACSS6W_006214 [Trichoderma asperelloides]